MVVINLVIGLGQLGDGRAINIMEGKVNGNYQTFQLKGAGPTPYSRSG